MKYLILILMALPSYNTDTVLFDFNTEETSGIWFTINDDVMGGVSESTAVRSADGIMTFKGTLSPDNNGGFASIRCMIPEEQDTALEGVSLRVKGDGNVYSIRFRTNRNFDGYAYQARIGTVENEWQEFQIPFADFKATFRGYELDNKPLLQPEDIRQIGILIADKQFGAFSLDIDWIGFY